MTFIKAATTIKCNIGMIWTYIVKGDQLIILVRKRYRNDLCSSTSNNYKRRII